MSSPSIAYSQISQAQVDADVDAASIRSIFTNLDRNEWVGGDPSKARPLTMELSI